MLYNWFNGYNQFNKHLLLRWLFALLDLQQKHFRSNEFKALGFGDFKMKKFLKFIFYLFKIFYINTKKKVNIKFKISNKSLILMLILNILNDLHTYNIDSFF